MIKDNTYWFSTKKQQGIFYIVTTINFFVVGYLAMGLSKSIFYSNVGAMLATEICRLRAML